MSKLPASALPLLLIGALAACSPAADAGGDLPITGDSEGLGKSDLVGLTITAINPEISTERLTSGGRAILTSAASWEDYMGTPAPAEVDFDRHWVAFYGAGIQNTGGYSATIVGLSQFSYSGGLLLETHFQSPGIDCLVTQAMTWPHMVVAFDTPAPEPTWAVGDHESTVYRCGPTNEMRLAELADSLEIWEAARDDHDSSYHYSREIFSFLGFSAETDFVVESGVVVERHYKAQIGSDSWQWSEYGADVGSHTDEGHPVRLIDDLYEECRTEVLTQDEDDNWMHLSFDSDGILEACTYTPRMCQDDCTRGPTITDFGF